LEAWYLARLESPYHEGELPGTAAGSWMLKRSKMEKSLLTAILKGALKFIEQQPMPILGSVMHSRMSGHLCCSGIRLAQGNRSTNDC